MEYQDPLPRMGALTRRQVLGGVAGGLLGSLSAKTTRAEVAREPRRLVYLFLSGGASQLETWDPKTGSATGGPFGAISTTASGVQISGLLPSVAKQMRHLALIRSVNSSAFGEEHLGEGILTGRPAHGTVRFPTLPEIAAAHLASPGQVLPAYVELQSTDAFRFESHATECPLGLEARPILVTNGKLAATGKAVDELLVLRDVLDSRGLTSRDPERYGESDLGRHLSQARRLLEAGVPVVKIRHPWWDTHAEHFEGHRRLGGELDRALSALVQDLHDRGLLESTLVVVASEFGRSPQFNRHGGRDHWPHAWSVALAGAGISGGTVVGRTSPDGREVVEREVTPAHLHHTCISALGIDPDLTIQVGGRSTPLADPSGALIPELFG